MLPRWKSNESIALERRTFPFLFNGIVRHTFKIDGHDFFDPENLNDDLPVLVDILCLKKWSCYQILYYNYVFYMLTSDVLFLSASPKARQESNFDASSSRLSHLWSIAMHKGCKSAQIRKAKMPPQ